MTKVHRKPIGDNDRRRRWLRDFKKITSDASYLWTDCLFWEMFGHMVEGSPVRDEKSFFWSWLEHCYVEAKAFQIRRICDREKKGGSAKADDSVSLHMLLSEIRDCPKVLSLDWLKKEHQDDELIENLEALYGKGLRCLPHVVQEDIASLERASEEVKVWVDQYVAHHDRTPKLPPALWYRSIKRAAEEISRIVRRYGCLLTGRDIDLRMRLGQWRSIFWQAWARRPR